MITNVDDDDDGVDDPNDDNDYHHFYHALSVYLTNNLHTINKFVVSTMTTTMKKSN